MKQILAGNRSGDKETFLIRHSVTTDKCATILRCDLNSQAHLNTAHCTGKNYENRKPLLESSLTKLHFLPRML